MRKVWYSGEHVRLALQTEAADESWQERHGMGMRVEWRMLPAVHWQMGQLAFSVLVAWQGEVRWVDFLRDRTGERERRDKGELS
jgi:hypothetical protein